MPAVPASEANQLIKDLRLRAAEGPMSEFEFARYEKRARAVMKAEPAHGHCIMGIIQCLRGDLEGCRKHHEAAKDHDPGDAVLSYNFACSLEKLGQMEEAFKHALHATALDDMDLACLNKAVWLAYENGAEQLPALLDRWQRLNNGEEHSVVEEMEDEEALAELEGSPERETVPWREAKERLRLQ